MQSGPGWKGQRGSSREFSSGWGGGWSGEEPPGAGSRRRADHERGREVHAFAARILGPRPRRSPVSHRRANKARGAVQTLRTAGKQGPSVPFKALVSLILYLRSPSEERTHGGSFITALITAAGMTARGCAGPGLCSNGKPIPF